MWEDKTSLLSFFSHRERLAEAVRITLGNSKGRTKTQFSQHFAVTLQDA